jgi:hypothetical protein
MAHAAPPPRRLALGLRLAVLALVPLLLVGPSLRPGHRFLPQAPVVYEPLASEFPQAAARARVGLNHWTGDRIFPALTDQYELRRRLFAGEGWWFEPRLGLGSPLLGNTIHGPLYPPNLLALLLPPDLAAAPLAMLSLLLAGAGLWALLARLGLGEGACAFGALAVQAVGFGVTNLHYGMKVDSALWLPWCLWAVEGLRRGERRSGPWLGLFVGLSFLAGFPTLAVFSLGATLLAALLRLRRGSALLACGGAVLLGLALGAAQLGPTLAASAEGLRGSKTAEQLALEAAAPGACLGLLAPQLFGTPAEPRPAFGPVAAWWVSDPADWARTQSAAALEWDPYAGLVVVLLGSFAVLTLGRGERRPLAPLGLLLLSYGFAQDWPGCGWLYHLPGLDRGAPVRALSLAWIAWPWLAALGLDALGRNRRPRAALVWFALVAASGAGGALALGDGGARIAAEEQRLAAHHGRSLEEVRAVLPPEQARSAAERLGRGLWLTAGTAAILGTVLLARSSPRLGALGRTVPFLLLGGEALLFSRPHLAPRDLGGLPLWPDSPALAALAEATGEGRFLRLDTSASGVEQVVDLARPNLPQAYGVADVGAYVVFTPRATVELFATVDPRAPVRSGVGRLSDSSLLDHPWLDGAGITCLLSREALVHPRLSLHYGRPGFHVYRRHGAAPLCRTAGEDGAALAAELRGDRLWIPSGSPASVLTLVASPSWHITAPEGRAGEVLPTAAAGEPPLLHLPAAPTGLELRYRPRGGALGLALAAAGTVLLGLWSWVQGRRAAS